MPLRANLDGMDIFAFEYNEESWGKLKATYRSCDLIMPCCDSKAVPKKSKLGQYFFAHSRKGECKTSSETAEHIFLKSLIAKQALELGWKVETEKPGQTPTLERWIADVFCSKGKANLAFEVQWSHQTIDEFERRQEKYRESNVRAAWLYKLKGNKEYFWDELPYSHETPVFGMKYRKGTKDLYIPQFDVDVDQFISGVLSGNLQWSPKEGEELLAKVIPHSEPCWKCKKTTTMVLGVSFYNKQGVNVALEVFGDSWIPKFLREHIGNDKLRVHGVGTIKPRSSKTRNDRYLSNGCVHCDAIMGNFFVSEAFREYLGYLPDPIIEIPIVLGREVDYLGGEWFFKGKASQHFFK